MTMSWFLLQIYNVAVGIPVSVYEHMHKHRADYTLSTHIQQGTYYKQKVPTFSHSW